MSDDEDLEIDLQDARARLGAIVANHRLLAVLGVGGMASVYEAQDLRTGGRVALKILHSRFARRRDIAARFYEEGQAWKVIGHPSVVRVLDTGVDAAVGPYLSMELLQGQTLRDWMQGRPAHEVMPWVIAALEPLTIAHTKGVVHRDLKPENLFVQLRGGTPHDVKILDFGIAKLGDARPRNPVARTRTGMRFGTLAYVSPEQAKNSKNATPASDVWSFGVILFEVLTGTSPIAQLSTGEIFAELFGPNPLPRVRDVAPDVPTTWQRLTDLCLHKDPQERPTTAELLDVMPELLDELAPEVDDADVVELATSSDEAAGASASDAESTYAAWVRTALSEAIPRGWELDERRPGHWFVHPRGGGWLGRYYEVVVSDAGLVVTHGNTDAGAYTMDHVVHAASVLRVHPRWPLPDGLTIVDLLAHVFRSHKPNLRGMS